MTLLYCALERPGVPSARLKAHWSAAQSESQVSCGRSTSERNHIRVV